MAAEVIHRILWMLLTAVIVLVVVVAGASAAQRLRGCGLVGDSYVYATSTVTCSTAIYVYKHSCGQGQVCHVRGFTCRFRSTGRYSFRITCARGRRRIVATGGT